MLECYKPFMPENPIQGRAGYYPCANAEEWSTLPLPLRCATWYRNDIESVIFSTWLDNYKFKANIEVHPDHVFKALFTLSNDGTLLYTVVGIRLKNGVRLGAKWLQDKTSGAYAIVFNGGGEIAKQGGYMAHMPENCIEKTNGGWGLATGKTGIPLSRYCLV